MLPIYCTLTDAKVLIQKFIGVCTMISNHRTKMMSRKCMFIVFGHLSKIMFIVLLLIMVT